MVKDAASLRTKLPLSRYEADELRPAKTHEFAKESMDTKTLLGLFSQGNRRSNRGFGGGAQGSNGGSGPASGERKARISSHNKRRVRKSMQNPKSSASPKAKKKKVMLVKPELSTFDELSIAASKIRNKFEELTRVSAVWEGHDKSEARQLQAGLVKDVDGNWRDIDGMLVESISVQEDTERIKVRKTINELFKELEIGEADLNRVLKKVRACECV